LTTKRVFQPRTRPSLKILLHRTVDYDALTPRVHSSVKFIGRGRLPLATRATVE